MATTRVRRKRPLGNLIVNRTAIGGSLVIHPDHQGWIAFGQYRSDRAAVRGLVRSGVVGHAAGAAIDLQACGSASLSAPRAIAEAERARRLRAEATTRWLKEHLADEIARHEQIAGEIERAAEPSGDSTP
jgi:hypothetical protein